MVKMENVQIYVLLLFKVNTWFSHKIRQYHLKLASNVSKAVPMSNSKLIPSSQFPVQALEVSNIF